MKIIILISALMLLWGGAALAAEIAGSGEEPVSAEFQSQNPPEDWWPPDWPIPPQIPPDENSVPEPSSMLLLSLCGWVFHRIRERRTPR